MLNQVIILGRLTKEPELKQSEKGMICNFTLAIDNYGKDNGTSFLNIVVLSDKIAQNCYSFLHKGDRAIVSGRIQQRSYLDKNQVKKSVVEIIGESVEFIEPKEKTLNDEEVETAEAVQDSDLPF